MDTGRQLRFVVAPFFFFASLLWGYYLAQQKLPNFSSSQLLTALGVAFFPIGFLIATVSHLVLKLIFFLATRNWSEVRLEDSAFARIWSLLHVGGDPDRRWEYYASASFDHGILGAG